MLKSNFSTKKPVLYHFWQNRNIVCCFLFAPSKARCFKKQPGTGKIVLPICAGNTMTSNLALKKPMHYYSSPTKFGCTLPEKDFQRLANFKQQWSELSSTPESVQALLKHPRTLNRVCTFCWYENFHPNLRIEKAFTLLQHPYNKLLLVLRKRFLATCKLQAAIKHFRKGFEHF